jgi:hypothetical protein
MIAPLAKFIDWSAIQAATLMKPSNAHDPRLEEALQFLKGPDFVRTDSQPAQPDIWRLPHGHVGVCCGFVPGLPGRVIDWLTPRLNGNTAQTPNK